MSVSKVHRSQAAHQQKSEVAQGLSKKHSLQQKVQVQASSSKSLTKPSCGQRILETIQKIWKAICDFFCCRTCRKTPSIKKPESVASSSDIKPQVTFNRTVKPNKPDGRTPKPSDGNRSQTDKKPQGTNQSHSRTSGSDRAYKPADHTHNRTPTHTHGNEPHSQPAPAHNHNGNAHNNNAHNHGNAPHLQPAPAHNHNDHAHNHSAHNHANVSHSHQAPHNHNDDAHNHSAHNHANVPQAHTHDHSHAHNQSAQGNKPHASDGKYGQNGSFDIDEKGVQPPSTPINNPKIHELPANIFELITLPRNGVEMLSHARVTMKGTGSAETPAYLGKILKGQAGELLIDADMEERREPTNWGTGEIASLGECSCSSLSRTKKPEIRREFDETVLANVAPLILKPGTKRYSITNFATGCLFASFVQAVQLVQELKEKNWQGRIIWNVIDTDYANAIRSKFTDGSHASKAVLCFKDQMAKLLPPGVAFELNVFGSHNDYIFAAEEDRALRYNFLMGMDLAHAWSIWGNQELSVAGQPEAFEFQLAKIGHPSIPEYQQDKGVGKPQCRLRRIDQRDPLRYDPDSKESHNKGKRPEDKKS